MKTAKELEEVFGYTTEELDKMAEPWERSELPPGVTIRRGKGRPRTTASDLFIAERMKNDPDFGKAWKTMREELEAKRKKKCVYEAIVKPVGELFEVTFPDLDIITQGDDLQDAAFMAQDLLENHIAIALQAGKPLPAPTFGNECPDGSYRMGIAVECEADNQQPWLEAYMELITNPITCEYEDLAEELGLEKAWFPLEHRGYVAAAGYSKEDRCYVGMVVSIDADATTISFDGETSDELQRHFEEAVECYLDAARMRAASPRRQRKSRDTTACSNLGKGGGSLRFPNGWNLKSSSKGS